MTSAAERLRESHRGFLKAAPASASRLAGLRTFGLRYVEVDDFNVIVEGDYQLNLAMSFWRAIDGSRQGYLVSALAAEIKRQHPISEKPAGGRDSGAEARTIVRQMTESALAESPAGPISRDRTSTASLLPEVRP